jgi:hypothetical protein
MEIVGKFDLDSDRLLDLLIEAQMRNFNNNIFTQLIQKFKG